MCRERDPLDCHRLHLICRYLAPRPWTSATSCRMARSRRRPATERRLLERAGPAELPLFQDSHSERNDGAGARLRCLVATRR